MQLPEDRPAFELSWQVSPQASASASAVAYGQKSEMQLAGTSSGAARVAQVAVLRANDKARKALRTSKS